MNCAERKALRQLLYHGLSPSDPDAFAVMRTGSTSEAGWEAISTNSFVARGAGGLGDTSGTNATALLAAFTSIAQGVVPASGGGTTNFLRADGTWAVP